MSLSPDGNTLALGRADGAIRLLRAAPWSETDQPQPVASAADRQVLLRWPPLPTAQGYYLYRGPVGAPPSQLRKLTPGPLSTTSYRDASLDLVNDRPLAYAVSALFRQADGRTVEGPRVRITATPEAVPAGWAGTSIHEGPHTGSVRFASGEITLRGSGADIWDQADGCYFANQPVAGDFEATVPMLTRPTATDERAQAGLMVRDSLYPGARHAFLLASATHGLQFKWRPAANQACEARDLIPHARLKLPVTLRLARHGNTLRAEYSEDGGHSFHPAGDPLPFDPPLPPALYVGLAITAHDVNKTSEVKFQHMEIQRR